ncbi:hypothetical protein FOL46_001800 [Perkinsus olseni]|uniref:Major facilitator superfamily (MFS) profile domain-containing protein n=2 Tax=Perkinsus olseni TaxID=32597 RepID=A0A7J6KQ37_PEROL|nr:hypothetical protein FOL46_001800 [Perkinsus olseni]
MCFCDAVGNNAIRQTLHFAPIDGSGERNTEVGLVASIFGAASLVLAMPAGWLIDHYSRARLLKIGSMVLTAALVLYLYGVVTDNLVLLYVVFFLYGAQWVIQSSASYSLFADSLPHGHRADAMSTVSILQNVAGGTGPFLGVILVHVLGNEWQLPILHRIIVIVGLVEFPTNWINTLWRDVEHHEHSDTNISIKGGDAGVGETVEVKILTDSEKVSRLRAGYGWLVPYVISLNDVITSIGAGMTVRYFPLFFMNDYGFSPMQLQILVGSYSIVIGIATYLCNRTSKILGRVKACFLFAGIGTACLYGLSYLYSLPLLLVVYFIRGGFQNAVYPLDRSLIMDYVVSKQRGRWNAVESITAASWAGSAALGGWLCDGHDYRYAFGITAHIYTVALLMRIPLFFLVKEKIEDHDHDLQTALLEDGRQAAA